MLASYKKQPTNIALRHFVAKSSGEVHLILKQPKLNEGEGAKPASIMDTQVGSPSPGASWRAGVQPWIARNNEAVRYNRELSAGLLRHLMDYRRLLADSPLHFSSVGSYPARRMVQGSADGRSPFLSLFSPSFYILI